MAEVKLFKKNVQYVDKEGKDRTATNFFISCGDLLVPVEVKYFEDKDTGRDDRYRERKVLLSAFAETLPDKPANGGRKDKPAKPVQSETLTDEQIPF